MKGMKSPLKKAVEYIKNFAKWIFFALCTGMTGGVIGALFHLCVEHVSKFRLEHSFIIYFLPVAGLLIAALYKVFSSNGKLDTNRIIKASSGEAEVPAVIAPLIFISTVITQMFGGSAGREGAALQIGGGIGYKLGKIFRLKNQDICIITTAGMSSVFAALFGTPVTAAIFPLEMIKVGTLNFTSFLPCIIASVTASYVSSMFGVSPVTFDLVINYTMTLSVLVKIILLALCCSVLGIIFCVAIQKTEKFMDNILPNCYLRVFAGGAVIVLLTVLVGTYDYNGAGMEVIMRAVSGEARTFDFLFKIIFTAITISAGFKGGEIIPTLFIGSTFGCVMSSLLGIEPGFGAAIGMISLFCSVVNCPIASILLSVEMFGSGGLLFFAVACSVSYKMSGYFGMYNSQRFVYSKLTSCRMEENNQQLS